MQEDVEKVQRQIVFNGMLEKYRRGELQSAEDLTPLEREAAAQAFNEIRDAFTVVAQAFLQITWEPIFEALGKAFQDTPSQAGEQTTEDDKN